jgi:hypothetical protein
MNAKPNLFGIKDFVVVVVQFHENYIEYRVCFICGMTIFMYFQSINPRKFMADYAIFGALPPFLFSLVRGFNMFSSQNLCPCLCVSRCFYVVVFWSCFYQAVQGR